MGIWFPLCVGPESGDEEPGHCGTHPPGQAPGVRGGLLLMLTVTKAMSGTISGSFDLTPVGYPVLRGCRRAIQVKRSNLACVLHHEQVVIRVSLWITPFHFFRTN